MTSASVASQRVTVRGGAQGIALRRAATAPLRAMRTKAASLSVVAAAPMTRNDVTELIVFNRMKKGVTWASLAEACGRSLPWVTSALLGQHQMTKEMAEIAGKMLDLPEDAIMLLQFAPYKGSLPTSVPTDPLIYRFYEMVAVYGTTYKEMIHEEFGDGIMSAIDFDMDFSREENDKGDRVKIVLTGKYLTYREF
eukprot:CAMPEP_0181395836 /NCGR_PEP_ID=MMETSP1106-20121128/28559_1 /TAXON_ID=81844 /ORGANISM="Mantoniella antarctica, Strain SL-175" /LENGTH=194 /DNA_ID=CAMNT_0023517497 /DNA_START=82 /DNA_END=666 /DNA_ORIENTATION=+